MFQVHAPLPQRMRCSVCGCCEAEHFVIDHSHGAMICTRCGAEIPSFQVLLPTFNDFESHRQGEIVATNQVVMTTAAVSVSAAAASHAISGPAVKITTLSSSSSSSCVRKPKLHEVRQSLELLKTHFDLTQNEILVNSSIAIYERKIELYASYILKPSVWAAAVFFLYNCQNHLVLTFREMALVLQIEAKKISKAVRVIRKHDPIFSLDNSEHIPDNTESVTRLCRSFGLAYKHEVQVKELVGLIDREELISGLNPLSILSVSFFYILVLKRTTVDAELIKRTLHKISKVLLIAMSTIRKGTKEVRLRLLAFIVEKKWFPIKRIDSLNSIL